MDELRLEIPNARTSEQQTDKAFVLLNKEVCICNSNKKEGKRRSNFSHRNYFERIL